MASNFLSPNYNTATQTPSSSSQRGVAMVLALISAVVLSPLYVTRSKNDHHHYYYERKLLGNTSYSTFVLPLVLGGLIIAIRTTSSSSSSSASMEMQERASLIPSPEPSWVLRIGSSSWGLAGVLVMLLLVLSWQVALEEAKPLFLHFNGGQADRRQADRKREEKDDGRGEKMKQIGDRRQLLATKGRRQEASFGDLVFRFSLVSCLIEEEGKNSMM
ncbi:hypothetical protein LWI29_005892 [Acer saccharum]|uniref:Uncharacterized protein n=1 Tax=Acer saccharum TaxID=4024 RepID=A0AA39VR14_ACESA|nr:hypothetical protein LWI29_005892 [Acer saccharum]